ncbi:OmpW family outer membrane protein [uncultured Xylophilus sp.]|uniref:OmpW/AlkL family protein n=1 Tax=uncultured Xylophilus sp. TaxID=296832 RepID=UPI0025DB4D13|nr:OmpW family outer membrane protein [uncultured Xylophilus sp.]
MKHRHLLAAACVLAAAGTAAQAQQASEPPSFLASLSSPTPSTPWTVRGGVSHIVPHSRATDATGPLLPPNPSGVSLRVEDKTTAFFSIARAITPNTEVELALGYPPTHDVTARIASYLPANVQGYNGQTIAKVRQMAPTLFVNYAFGEPTSRLRPFVGLGVNYTKFDKRTSTAAGNGLNGGPTRIELEDSWGLAAQAGLDYKINERWSIHGSLATARVKTHLVATTAGQARELDIKFRPVVFTLAAAYRF